jgi:bis(5'-nucleosidyl)-tetraphosphatase
MRVSYGVFAVQDGRVLVIHQKWGDHWTFCKGRPERGESPVETAVRELREETGLKVKRFLSEAMFSQTYMMKNVRKTVHFFAAEVEGSVQLQESELRNHTWLPPAQVPERLTYDEDRDLAERIMKKLNFV